MAASCSALHPRRARRRSVSRQEKPQSTMTRVEPDSMSVALPRLPLPRDANLMVPAGDLAQLLLQQRQDPFRGTGVLPLALGVVDDDLRFRALCKQHDPVLFGFRLVRRPESQFGQQPLLVLVSQGIV